MPPFGGFGGAGGVAGAQREEERRFRYLSQVEAGPTHEPPPVPAWAAPQFEFHAVAPHAPALFAERVPSRPVAVKGLAPPLAPAAAPAVAPAVAPPPPQLLGDMAGLRSSLPPPFAPQAASATATADDSSPGSPDLMSWDD